MLATIKTSIKNSPCICFEQFFNEYVMDVQDSNIDEEVDFLLRNNFLDSYMLSRLVESDYQGYIL